MHNSVKRATAAALCAVLAASALTGCSSKKGSVDTAKTAATLGDETMSTGAVNFLLRYNQAQYESGMGQFVQYYYGDMWNVDLYGTGEVYATVFKQELQDKIEKMMAVKANASDLGVELTDEDQKKISEAAAAFLAANDQETLDKMSATQETVEEALTYMVLQSKGEAAMTKDVDTEVSDEEAAQRTVSYVAYVAQTEAEEAVSEGASEAASENMTGEGVAEVVDADVEAETDVKTKTAAETEGETVVSAEEASEAVGEAIEVSTEAVTEAETETDSPEMAAAKAEAQANAEAFLEEAQKSDDWEALKTDTDKEDGLTDGITTGSFTFGDDDTYPVEDIIKSTKGLEDGAIVDHVIQDGTYFYIIHVDSAFDQEATDEKKEEIVNQRKNDAVNDKYDEITVDDDFKMDEDIFGKLLIDFSLTQQTEAATEGEVLSEAASEGASEVTSESVSVS